MQFYNGGTLLGTATAAPYTVNWSNVAVGNYTLTAKATDNLGIVTTSAGVLVHVLNTAPGVSITNPVNDAVLVAPATIALAASASDSNGTITKVAFYRGTTLIGSATTAPYTVNWANVAAGNYSLTAKATDNNGAVTTSAPVNVAVITNTPPTVNLSATPTTAPAPATIALTATAADSDGSIAKVEFFNGVNQIAVVNQPPFVYNWTGLAAGSYSVTAKATDNVGSATTSSAINVTVTAQTGNADPDFAKVVVLLHLDGSLVDESPKPLTFATRGNARKYSTLIKKFGSASLLNTDGQYLDVPNFQALNDYTIEMWLYPTAYVGGQWGGFLVRALGGGDYLSLGFANSTGQGITTAFNQAVTTPAIPLENWMHVAVVRQGNIGTVYYNGAAVWSGPVSTASAVSNLQLFGAHDIASFPGNVDEFRISSFARYTGDFQVPTKAFFAPQFRLSSPTLNHDWNGPAIIPLTATSTAAGFTITQVEFFNGTTSLGVVTQAPFTLNWNVVQPGTYNITANATDDQGELTTSSTLTIKATTADFSNVAALLHMDESLADASLAARIFTDHGPSRTYATASKKFGTASLVNGPGQYLDIADFPALNDYTIEMWLNPGTYVGGQWGGFLARTLPGEYLDLGFANSTGQGITTAFNQAVVTPAIPLNTWTHLAVVRSGSVGTIYYNGTKVWTGTVGLTTAPGLLELFGAHDIASFIGNIDEFRISSFARYTADFVVPVTPTCTGRICVSSTAVNRYWNGPATIPLMATSIDPTFTIAQVEFFNGTTSLGSVTQAPFILNWSNVAAGDYLVTAQATNAAHVMTTSAAINISVKTNTTPTVSITAPAPDATYVAPASITLKAAASDVNGAIANVAYYQGTTLIGTATFAPYTVNWPNVAPGTYSITARATDNDGGTRSSAPINITVIYNAPPTVSVSATQTSPTAPTTVALTATAADADGSIAQVEFFYNGINPIGTVTQAPFAYNWSGVGTGSFSVTARATDNLGKATTSAPVTVNVGAVDAAGGTIYYIHSDQINTPRVITDAGNNPVWKWDSDPFGATVPNENPGNLGSFTFNPRFPGQYFDKETNLHYNYFRDYDPSTGRYVQSDPIGLLGGINTYAYTGSNPLTRTDPTGLAWNCTTNGFITTCTNTSPGPIDPEMILPPKPNFIDRIINEVKEICEPKKCPACTPPAGSQCWTKDYGHSHKGLDPHYHTWQMNQNPSTCSCQWNKKRGTADTFGSEPGIQPCSAYGF